MKRNHAKARQRAILIALLVLMFMVCSIPRHLFIWMMFMYADHIKLNPKFWADWNTAGFYLYYTYPVLNSFSLYITSQQYKTLVDKYLFICRFSQTGEIIRDDDDEEEITYNSKVTSNANTDSTFVSTARALNMDVL